MVLVADTALQVSQGKMNISVIYFTSLHTVASQQVKPQASRAREREWAFARSSCAWM